MPEISCRVAEDEFCRFVNDSAIVLPSGSRFLRHYGGRVSDFVQAAVKAVIVEAYAARFTDPPKPPASLNRFDRSIRLLASVGQSAYHLQN